MAKTTIHIAIDGPVAAGKSTLSRQLSQKLNFLYIDTGAMYRLAAYLAKTNNLNYSQEDEIVSLVKKADIKMSNPTKKQTKQGRLINVYLNDKDVSEVIREQEYGNGASQVAVLKKLRQIMVQKQQELAKDNNVVMEGRDITFRVLPQAKIKIYLTADPKIRAKRRLKQLRNKGKSISFDEVLADLKDRDHREMTRKHDPLQIVEDAWVIDSTNLSKNQIIEMIIKKVKQHGKKN